MTIKNLLARYALLQQNYELASSIVDDALAHDDKHEAAKYLYYVNVYENERNEVYELIYLYDEGLLNAN